MRTALRTIILAIREAWNPRTALFANNEVGVWYDPSDLTSMFQDSAGTTPVTAVEQPVGLILDKSKGLVLGAELVDTLNAAAAWGAYGTNTIADDTGAVKITYVDNASGAYAYLSAATGLSANLVIAKRYVVSGEAKVSSGSVNLSVPVVTFGAATITSTTYVSFSFQFVCASAANDFLRADSMGAGEAIWLRNISVRELPGAHAVQATAASRPTLSARKNWLLATTTLSTQNVTVLAGQMVLSFYGTGTVTLSGTSTAGPLVGTGVADRVSLTFTPTAGTLTLTVSGSVTQAQLEYVA